MQPVAAVAELVTTVIALLLISAVTLAVSRRLRLPFTVLLVVVGVLLRLLAEHGPEVLRPLGEHDVSPDVILYVFLPTLIFESAFNLDARLVRRNLAAILTLAIPGLLLSTAIIGIVLALGTPFGLAAALLLGAILSATDPVAVVALFRQLGAPERLLVLVEGESLFNDATSIVLAGILVGVVSAGQVGGETLLAGVLSFFGVFLGGVLTGWVAAVAVGLVLGRVRGDGRVEITLTTILAYLSFLVAEELLHVSGVMAVVAAGMTLGGWGRVKISPSVRGYLEHFWEYLAFVANALIFLLVGLRVDPGALLGSIDLLAWVVLAMLLSRAAVIYGLVPLVGHFPGSEPVGWRYRHVMYWGGLRGAIALAIVLSLPAFEHSGTFVALVMGAVLFTLLVQGLTIEGLVHRLGLDRPAIGDSLARTEGELAGKRLALSRIPELQHGGLFSARIADALAADYRRHLASLRRDLDALRERDLDADTEQRLLFVRCLASERAYYEQSYARGHLSERAYRDLDHSTRVQSDELRHGGVLPHFTLHPPHQTLTETLLRLARAALGFTPLPERWRSSRVVNEYEEAWGRYQGCLRVLDELADIAEERAIRAASAAVVRDHYAYWSRQAAARIDSTAEQFPEFVTTMQRRLASRLLLVAEQASIEREARNGLLPAGIADRLLADVAERLDRLRGGGLDELRIDPGEMLRGVPIFRSLASEDYARLARVLRSHTLPAGEAVFAQDAGGNSMFLIGRGVIRVSRREADGERDLATLLAGDFFGEMALLHGTPRSATCRAVTPCVLYELHRADFTAVCDRHPTIRAAVESVDRQRAAELAGDRPD